MGTITILPETPKDPLALIGRRAGICWNADIINEDKNIKRGIDCLKSGHGRTLEFVDVLSSCRRYDTIFTGIY